MLQVVCKKDYEEASRAAADLISAQILLKPDCKIGLATPMRSWSANMKPENLISARSRLLTLTNTRVCREHMIRATVISWIRICSIM